jgi:hypothetical protein
MIKIENTEVMGWEAAIRGMRNPMNSWEKSDSGWFSSEDDMGVNYVQYNSHSDPSELYFIGSNDLNLMKRLAKAGTDHRKFMRMITVYMDITAPLYWWKEFDTYKVGTVANSCSTMHKITEKEFEMSDFSCEHMKPTSIKIMHDVIDILNKYRADYNNPEAEKLGVKKDYWWQMIQILPSSYNQRRTVMLNYEVLANIYKSRKDHKLDEWRVHETPEEHKFRNKDFSSGMWGFCDWIESLPYSELITKKGENNNEHD